jgi:NAD(P) transhydrogenase subunit alpha
MTPVLLVSCYFVALAAFLGLDILSKVPATLYPVVLASLGAVCGVVLVGGWLVATRAPVAASAGLGTAAAALGAAAAGAGLSVVVRLSRALVQRPRRS